MASPATPLPPVVFEDGLGQRRRVIGARNQTLSVLFLDGELTAAPAFEAALRERIAQFSTFQHDAFARARGVVHLSKVPPRLALASDFVEGVRLSEMLAVAEQRLIPLEINAAFGVIRQLVPALAALHQLMPEASHGALAPERIVVTDDARVVVAEHVLGPALEQLRFSEQRYWRELRIPLPPSGAQPQFDRRADATQLGAIALALIVGRPLREDEYPERVAEIVDGVRAVSATGLEQLPAGVQAWLRRALQLEGRRSFASAIEVQAELEGIYDIDDYTAREALRAFVAQCQSMLVRSDETAPADDSGAAPTPTMRRDDAPGPRLVVPSQPVMAAEPARPEPTPVIEPMASTASAATGEPIVNAAEPARPAESVATVEPFAREQTFDRTAEVRVREIPKIAAMSAPPMFGSSSASDWPEEDSDAGFDDAPKSGGQASTKPVWRRVPLVAAVAALIAIASVGTMAARGYLASDPAGTLVVNTNPTGVTVVIDGQHRGSTPLSLDLPPGKHMLQIVSDGQVRAIPVTIAEGREIAQFIELPTVAPAPGHGQLQVRTEPAGARVAIDNQYRGVSPMMIEGLAPGAHSVKLEDGSTSVTEQVMIEAGATASLVVPLGAPKGVPVSGWISISAPVDVQVYENQRLLGSSRSEQIMVSAGRHEFEIVNETLGYRTSRTVQVTAGNTATVTLDWPKGSLALNAQPWAEVWVGGERIGQTPIANISRPIGTHEVILRHPQLGERRATVTVSTTQSARLGVDMRAP